MPDMSLAYASLSFSWSHDITWSFFVDISQRTEYSSEIVDTDRKHKKRRPLWWRFGGSISKSIRFIGSPKVVSLLLHLQPVPAFRMDPGMRDMGYGQVGGPGGWSFAIGVKAQTDSRHFKTSRIQLIQLAFFPGLSRKAGQIISEWRWLHQGCA
jgi:hypothetical protein